MPLKICHILGTCSNHVSHLHSDEVAKIRLSGYCKCKKISDKIAFHLPTGASMFRQGAIAPSSPPLAPPLIQLSFSNYEGIMREENFNCRWVRSTLYSLWPNALDNARQRSTILRFTKLRSTKIRALDFTQ